MHDDGARLGVEDDLGGEALADELVADHHGGDQHLLAVAALAALEFQRLAERQELGIALDIGDEPEHVVSRMGDAGA